MELLRIVLGLLAVFFAHYLGRSAARVRRQKLPKSAVYTWVLRTTVCLMGVYWGRGADLAAILFSALAAASLASGIHVERRVRKTEHLEDLMFPKD
jgi:hypothetical protein